MRINSKWHKTRRKDNVSREKTPEELAGAAGFIAWRIAMKHMDEIEEAGFKLASGEQRFEVLSEFLVYFVQVVDREVFLRLEEDQRAPSVTAFALHLAGTLEDNQIELLGPGEYRQAFIERLNREIPDYAELGYGEDGPGYRFMRYLGEKVLEAIQREPGEQANRWVIDQVMEIEAPDATDALRKTLDDLLRGQSPREPCGQIPEGGVS